MKQHLNFKKIALLGLPLCLTFGSFLSIYKNQSTAVNAYTSSSLPTTIDLNPVEESEIRSYYNGVQGKNKDDLLMALKPILMNNQKYYSYDSSNKSIWKMYEITDRDWELSPASTMKSGTYDPTTNIITNYKYENDEVEDPYVRALYVNREADNPKTAWASHGERAKANTIEREHIWPKSHGFDTDGAGGARGDPMHLWAADGTANGMHSNLFYGYVDKAKTYKDAGNTHDILWGNLTGTSKTIGSGTVFEPQDSDKGDIARACFYMVARYNNLADNDNNIDTNNPNLTLADDLSENDRTGTSTSSDAYSLGLIQDLLEWNKLDPVDEYEIKRNDLLYVNYTKNRNPFIDFPEWADIIWGNKSGTAQPSSDELNGSDEQEDDESNWQLVTEEQDDWTGTYLLASGNNGNVKVLDPASLKESAFSGIDATVSNNKLTGQNISDSLAIEIEKSTTTDKYKVKIDDGFIGKNANSNGVDFAETFNTNLDNNILYTDGKVYIKGNGGRTLTWYNSNSNFKYYASSNNCTQLYKKAAESPDSVLSSITVSGDYKKAYLVGEEFDTTDLVVTAHYTQNDEEVDTKDVTSSCKFTGFDSEEIGTKTITVTYEGLTTSFTVKVNDSLTAKVEEPATSGWHLVNNEKDLVKDGIYTIASINKEKVALPMGDKTFLQTDTSDNGNMSYSDGVLTPETGVAPVQLVLGGSKGNWTLNDGVGLVGAIAAKAFTHNEGTTTWNISFAGDNVVIESTNTECGTIQYNTGSPRFLNYTSNQGAISLFKYVSGNITKDYTISAALTEVILEQQEILDAACANLNVSTSTWTSIRLAILPFLDDPTSNDYKALMFGKGKSSLEGGNALEDFLQRYDEIVYKYGYESFIEKGEDSRTKLADKSLKTDCLNNDYLPIVIISLSACAAMVCFLAYKKKKND